ncbi:sensor histidine kinase [Nitriliruptoraceae bacterium ZYF776]|nr:sensor histidine kinase [Profundirhabdus halotolerans]
MSAPGRSGTADRVRGHGRRLVRAVGVDALAVLLGAGVGSVVLVLVLGRLPTGREQPLVVPAVAALLVALAVQRPLRARLAAALEGRRRWVGRTPEAVLDGFGDRESRDVPTDELLLELAGALRHDLRLDAAEVWVAGGRRLERRVASPARVASAVDLEDAVFGALQGVGVVGDAWLHLWLPDLFGDRGRARIRVAPVEHAGVLLGLLVAERPGDTPFAVADERRLADLAGQLGVALHNRQLDEALAGTLAALQRANLDLHSSRARLVSAADAERRRIERDLHDGAQQHLVALAVDLRLVRDLVGDDPDAAVRELERIGGRLQGLVGELRDLAHGIFPPLLRDGGLGAALPAIAARSPARVRVRVDDVGRHAPEVEAALYFACLESLQNAAKHAPGAAVRVESALRDGALHLAVADDGPGFDPDAPSAGQGRGRDNVRDRIGAIGGHVTWDSAPGRGCVVRVTVPVVPSP